MNTLFAELFVVLFSVSILSYLFIVWFSKIFYRYNILDNPKKYKKNRKPIPYGIGIIFFLLFFISSFVVVDYTYKLGLIWLFGFIITFVSFVDDRLNVSAKYRLLLQIVIWATIALTSIKIWYVSSIFGWVVELETFFFQIWNYTLYVIPFLFTIIWYVFIFNALNWTDGISGNTSWLSIISFFILFLLGLLLYFKDDYSWWVENAVFIMKICIILLGILIPFWYFDVKEKVLMWDTWTMFLWFMLATLAIISWGKIATVLVVFWIYSVDAVYVIIKRLAAWKNPLSWDFTHLHHRLEKVWVKKIHFLFMVYFLSFFFWITALFLDRMWKIFVFILIIFIVVFMNRIVEIVKKKRFLWK